MKKIFFLFFIIIMFHLTSSSQCPQVSKQVLTTHHGEVNEVGAYNSFGLRITLDQTYSADVTVTGVIFDSENHNVSANFNITVPAGYSTQDADDLLSSGRESYADAEINSISPCFISYGGVTIIYEIDNHILRFGNFSDVYSVLNQLDEDYDDNYNDYDGTLDTSLSVAVLDSLDEVNEFDPRVTYKNFEALFFGYHSKRAQIEATEVTWLDNDFSGTNPTDIDLTFYDALNAICNTDYSFKVGTDTYSLASDGLYINGILQEDGGTIAKNNGEAVEKSNLFVSNVYSGPADIDISDLKNNQIFHSKYDEIVSSSDPSYTVCKSNKKKVATAYYNNDTERYELEVAIHTVGFRSGVHGKVVHFKKKNNKWKRSRAQMTAGVGGAIYGNNCNGLANINETNPYSGYKKREELKAMRHCTYGDYYKVWKTYSSQLGASFTTPNSGQSGTLTLTF